MLILFVLNINLENWHYRRDSFTYGANILN